MGLFDNISSRTPLRIAQATGLRAFLVLVGLLLSAVPSSASDSRARTPERAVSMSPEVLRGSRLEPGAAPPKKPTPHAPPLTRAAVKERVEGMSPLPWLTRYGEISIDRRE
jgi:hypothetical protein